MSSALSPRRESALSADVRVADRDAGATVAKLHQALFSAGLERALLEAIEEIPAALPDRQGAQRAALRELGVNALDGLYADVVVTAAGATARAREEPDDVHEERAEAARQELVEVTRQLGTGATPLGYRTTREDVAVGALAVLQAASVEPTVEVTLTGAFVGQRPEQREQVLGFLEELALAVDVELVLTGAARGCIRADHAADVAGHVTLACSPRRRQRAHARAERASESLARGKTPARVLEVLAGAASGQRSYEELQRALCLEAGTDARDRLQKAAERLEERHGLVERVERADGSKVVELRPAGALVVEEWAQDDQIHRQAETSWTDVGGGDDPPQISPAMPCNPAGTRGGEDGPGAGTAGSAADAAADADRPAEASSAGGDRPAAEGDAVTDGPGYAEGPVDVEYMSRARHEAAAAAGPAGAIGIVDGPVERDDDGRRPWWSYNSRREQLVVGAEYYNPMQVWVALARSLASGSPESGEGTLGEVLTPERLGRDLRGLETADKRLLRDARCIGWLSDDATGEDVVEDLRAAREELLDQAAEFKAGNYEDRDDARSGLLRFAHGLAGTVVHLLDLLGVEVVREVRVPSFPGNYSRESDRADLAKTVATGAAIQSRYGHFSAFRQLYEEREEKRERALNPEEQGSATGSLIGSFVLMGEGLPELEELLAAYLEGPRELHPDAPDIGISIPIETAARGATARAAERMLSTKNLRPTRAAVDVLHGFASDVYAVTAALNRGLAHEELRREVTLYEVRRALAQLEPARVLPEENPSVRAAVAALLAAEEPISQAELARRADITTQSWRNNREALVAAGLVEETGDGWVVCLPFSEERYSDVEEHLPWFLLEEATGPAAVGRALRHPTDVLLELVYEVGPTPDDAAGPVEAFAYSGEWPPDWEVVEGTLQQLGLEALWELICAGCGVDPSPTTVTMGCEQAVQATLGGVT